MEAFEKRGAKSYSVVAETLDEVEGRCNTAPNMELHQSDKSTHRAMLDTDSGHLDAEVACHELLNRRL